MVSRRIAEALLRLAARRWPARLRGEMHQEWLAELHVLAAERRTAAMLRYAASLTAARPVREPVAVAVRAAALWRAVRLCVLAPVAAVVVFAACLAAALTVLDPLLAAMPFGEQPRQWVAALATAAAAVVLARSGRWWTAEGAGIAALVLAITIPGFVFASLTYLLPAGMSDSYALHWPAYAVFFGGLAALLYAVDRLTATGRRTLAWWTGAVGALTLTDLAVTLPVLLSSGDDPPIASAPLWLFAALNGGGLDGIRLPGMTADQIWTVGDTTDVDAYIFLLYAGLALGVIMTRASRAVTASAPSTHPELT
ncbi:hypothetical protein FHX34_1021434 [Actinoplanes teichomyceticus]|uniref:Uncharacterized protein n=1 Tax=Actinoplanes teichomyceticus TaxID=1867 RepID=A0A561WLY1_ACTTI|nr:hypothetical protein FHX34_1021434 [Actinoplanes teichomyceticus]GIF15597.1 hypothetical protein Ate01nite_56290 [Actinoplanes teichomyceticus]